MDNVINPYRLNVVELKKELCKKGAQTGGLRNPRNVSYMLSSRETVPSATVQTCRPPLSPVAPHTDCTLMLNQLFVIDLSAFVFLYTDLIRLCFTVQLNSIWRIKTRPTSTPGSPVQSELYMIMQPCIHLNTPAPV